MYGSDRDNVTGIGELPDDPEKLKLLVTDLSRRLANAVHTIEAQKMTIVKANVRVETTRKQFEDLNRQLHLEIAKNATLTRRKQQDEEAKRYEKTKIFAEKLHEEFRLATIDHQISGASREPLRISKLHTKINNVELKQDSQKLLVSLYSIAKICFAFCCVYCVIIILYYLAPNCYLVVATPG